MMAKDPPPVEAYSTSTNPERFEAVIDHARGVIDRLIAEFIVEAVQGEWDIDFSRVTSGIEPPVRLTPSSGVPIVFGFTAAPGVILKVGSNVEVWLPDCLCDACDYQPTDMVHELDLHVDAVVSGGFSERIGWTKYGYRFIVPGRGERSSETRITHLESRPIGKRGTHTYEPWSHRPL